jgi:hypothetical protein
MANAPRSYSVGRSQPNDELALLGQSISQLRADVAKYVPPGDDPGRLGIKNVVTERTALLETSYHNFIQYLSEDWYWGDDDENRLTGIRNDYNDIRKQFIDLTNAHVEAPPIAQPPEIDPDHEKPDEDKDMTVKELLIYLALGAAGVGGAWAGWTFYAKPRLTALGLL